MKVFKKKKFQDEIFYTYGKLLDMWEVPINEKEVITAYGTTHVIEAGSIENPPLVLFHGVGDNSALMWVYNAKALSEHFHLIAVDTIGGPGKSQPNSNYNKEFDQVKWIDEVLDNLGLNEVYMAGVSNGAYLVQHYSVKRADRVIKGICMAGAVSDSTSTSLIKVMLRVFLPEALFPTKKNTVKLIKKLCGSNSHVFIDSALIMEHYGWLLRGFNNMAMAYHKVTKFSDEEIKKLQKKCLFLLGKADPLGDATKAKEKFERHGLDYQLFSEVGHGINHEISSDINKIMIEYFKN